MNWFFIRSSFNSTQNLNLNAENNIEYLVSKYDPTNCSYVKLIYQMYHLTEKI